MPSELPPSDHLPTSNGWTAELAVGLRFVVPTTGFETHADPIRFETLRFNHSVTLTLYKSLVRALLGSAGAIWSPYLIKHIKRLETVQRRATKLAKTIKNKSYGDRLRTLDLPSLEWTLLLLKKKRFGSSVQSW